RRLYIAVQRMSLCFVDPADAVRAIADSIGRAARRQRLGAAARGWVDEIPDPELEVHYAKAISELDEHDLSMLAAWHGSLEVGQPVPNRDFLMGAFGPPRRCQPGISDWVPWARSARPAARP